MTFRKTLTGQLKKKRKEKNGETFNNCVNIQVVFGKCSLRSTGTYQLLDRLFNKLWV